MGYQIKFYHRTKYGSMDQKTFRNKCKFPGIHRERSR